MLARGVAGHLRDDPAVVPQVRSDLRQRAASPSGPRPGDKWHLDEVFIKINGKTHYLWRAVDQDGTVLDILVTSRRDAKAATRFFRKLLTGLEYVPRVLVTDKLASYGVAHRRLMPGVEHRRSKYLNNRAENSHQPTRQRERAMKKFTSPGMAPSGSCPRSAGYHPTSGPDVTCSRARIPTRDGRPIRGLASGHRARRCRLKCERPNGVPSRLLQTQLRHYTFQST